MQEQTIGQGQTLGQAHDASSADDQTVKCWAFADDTVYLGWGYTVFEAFLNADEGGGYFVEYYVTTLASPPSDDDGLHVASLFHYMRAPSCADLIQRLAFRAFRNDTRRNSVLRAPMLDNVDPAEIRNADYLTLGFNSFCNFCDMFNDVPVFHYDARIDPHTGDVYCEECARLEYSGTDPLLTVGEYAKQQYASGRYAASDQRDATDA